MKNILIVGNGNLSKLKFIDYFSEYVILGRAIIFIGKITNKKIDKWVTRSVFLPYSSTFDINEIDVIPEDYSDEYNVKNPTLGYYSVLKYVNKNYKVFVTGITFDINSRDIDYGTWWDVDEKRDNMRHSILRETIILNKLRNKKVIYEL